MAERTITKPPTRDQLPGTRQILGYEPLFDIQAYQNLTAIENLLSPQEFSSRKTQLDALTRKNLETMLGERFNVEISRVNYQIRNNQLISPLHNEPFLDVIRRGQSYRQQNGSCETERELAEIESFEIVQHLLLQNPKTRPGLEQDGSSLKDLALDRKVVVISPRGNKSSAYQHNFIDVYSRVGDQVTMCRYTSSATYEQFRVAAGQIDAFCQLPPNPIDADFLKTPLVTYKNIEEILDLIPPDEGIITQQELEEINSFCAQIIINYVNNPSYQTFNALLNFADHIAKGPKGSDPLLDQPVKPFEIAQVISHFANLPTRQVSAGCGLQSGFMSTATSQLLALRSLGEGGSMVKFSPFSVSDFAFSSQINNSEDTSDFPCPRCGYIITYGAGIKKCPGCSLEATCA